MPGRLVLNGRKFFCKNMLNRRKLKLSQTGTYQTYNLCLQTTVCRALLLNLTLRRIALFGIPRCEYPSWYDKPIITYVVMSEPSKSLWEPYWIRLCVLNGNIFRKQTIIQIKYIISTWKSLSHYIKYNMTFCIYNISVKSKSTQKKRVGAITN